MVLVCWFATLEMDSRHGGSVLGLLVCYLGDGFKAWWKCLRSAGLLPWRRIQGMLEVFLVCWFATLEKDSRHAGSVLGLLVCYLGEGFKAWWKCF